MRIGLFIERFDAARGGRERSTEQIARELVRRGHQVEVVCMAGDAPGEAAFPVAALGGSRLFRAAALRGFVAAAGARIRRYDIAHAMFPLPGAHVYQLRGGTLAGLRAAHLRRTNWLWRPVCRASWRLNRARNLQARLERQVLADPRTWCLPVSRMVAGELERYYGRTDRVRVVYNAVAGPAGPPPREQGLALRRQLGLRPDDFVMLCPATNYELKGVLEAIQAFARFHRRCPAGRSSYLVVLGSRDDAGYRHIISAMGLAGHVLLLPPADDMLPLYAAADAVVLLSWYDPCSRVVLEALACGVPSITTRYNGASELLAEGAGLVVDSPRSRHQAAAAMAELAEPRRRSVFAAACRPLAGRVDMARHVEALLAVYEEILRS